MNFMVDVEVFLLFLLLLFVIFCGFYLIFIYVVIILVVVVVLLYIICYVDVIVVIVICARLQMIAMKSHNWICQAAVALSDQPSGRPLRQHRPRHAWCDAIGVVCCCALEFAWLWGALRSGVLCVVGLAATFYDAAKAFARNFVHYCYCSICCGFCT